MDILIDDVIKLMKAAREYNLLDFELHGLKFKLGQIDPVEIPATDNPGRRASDFQHESVEAKIAQAEEMRLTDPEGYEALIEQSLVGERLPMPELQDTATAPHEA